ncbi:MAG TPA: protein kinase [Candidatus Acidoferrum sp.]|nr:protein kinase [Candidatus Acidoferrum sp.]
MLNNIGKYEIVAELGQGAMGVVYKARDPLIGRMVALKTITSGLSGKPELLERFYQEARSAGALQHPNIVTIFELGKEGDTPYIAMEFLEGDSLEKIVARQDQLPLSKKIGFMSQICSALDYAHKHGVIHRDIKPGNIMLTKDGTVKVVDFGIARLVDTSKTQTGLMIGTPAYMSPQLLRGERADAQADIWALGVMLYEMIAYQRPFQGDNPAALMWAIISQTPKPLSSVAPGCPAELEEVVNKMLEKEASLRLQTMEDVLLELDPLYKRLQKDRLGELVAQSQQLIQNQELQRAQSLLREALHLDSSNAEAKTLLDRVGMEIRRMQAQARAKEQLAKAQALLDAGRLEEARGEAEAALRLDSKYEPAQQLVNQIKDSIERIKTLQEKLQSAKQRVAEGSLPEADKLVDETLALDPKNEQAQLLRRQIREETARREKRKKISDGLQQARGLWSQQKHLPAVEILSALQQEFPAEGEISELLITVRHDQAEQEKQELLAEVRNLLAVQRYEDALAALEPLRTAYPGDAAVRHLTGLVQQEQQVHAKRQRFEAELAALRAKVADSQWDEALKRGEQLQKEFPQEFELLELVKYVRAESQRAAQKRSIDEKIAQVRSLVDSGSFAQAIKAAEKALTEAPNQVDLMILLGKAQVQQKEREKHEFLEKRIREVKARINRDELTDAIDLARQTMLVAGPDTDITQLLHSAEMEISSREKKKEQDKQVDTAKTLINSGDFAGATRVLDQAMATQILDATDPRVQAALQEIRDTQEKQQREKEREKQRQKEQAEQQAKDAKEQERKKKEAADNKRAAEAKPEAAPSAREEKGGAAPSSPSMPSTPSEWPPKSKDPGRDYIYQSATMMQGVPTGTSEVHPVESSASATMIASGSAIPVIERPAEKPVERPVQRPTIPEPTVEVQSKSKKKKKGNAEAAQVDVASQPPVMHEEFPAKVAAPIWKQPIPLAIGGIVLASVVGFAIFEATKSPTPAPTPEVVVEPPASGTSTSTSGNAAAVTPAPPPAADPSAAIRNQQQSLIDQAGRQFAAAKYDDAQRLLDQAKALNGPLGPKIQGLEDQYKKAASDGQAKQLLAQENQLWDQAIAAFNGGNMDQASGAFQKITQMQGGVHKEDANDYLTNKIPARVKENNAFAEAQSLANAKDMGSLQKAAGDLNQVLQIDPGRADARNMLESVNAGITNLNNQQKQADQFAQLVSQYNNAVNAKDTQKLQGLQNDFRTIATSGAPQAGDARNYAENMIPDAIKRLTPAAAPPPAPKPAAPTTTHLNVSIAAVPHQAYGGPVNEGQMMSGAFLDQPLRLESSDVPVALASQGKGTVNLLVSINEAGKVYDGRSMGGDANLAGQLLAAAKASWQFNKPVVKGKGVKTTAVLTVQF